MHAGVETYAYVLEAEGQRLAYMPDVKSIPAASLEAMKGVDLLIIDGFPADDLSIFKQDIIGNGRTAAQGHRDAYPGASPGIPAAESASAQAHGRCV